MSPAPGKAALHRFDDLPAAVRRRLVEVAQRGSQDPSVLARDLDLRTGWFKYVLLLVSGAATGIIAEALLRPRACAEPQYMQETYAMLAAALAVFWMSALTIARRVVVGAPPFAPGRYVFSSGLVKLDGHELEFIPLASVPVPQVTTVLRNYRYSHTDVSLGFPWSFRFERGPDAKTAATLIAAAREGGPTPGDPFASCVQSGSWTAPAAERGEGPRHGPPPAVLRWLRFPGGLAVGLLVAGALYVYCRSG